MMRLFIFASPQPGTPCAMVLHSDVDAATNQAKALVNKVAASACDRIRFPSWEDGQYVHQMDIGSGVAFMIEGFKTDHSAI